MTVIAAIKLISNAFLIVFTLIFTVLFVLKLAIPKHKLMFLAKFYLKNLLKNRKNEKDDSEKNFSKYSLKQKELIILNQEKFYHFSKKNKKKFYP